MPSAYASGRRPLPVEPAGPPVGLSASGRLGVPGMFRFSVLLDLLGHLLLMHLEELGPLLWIPVALASTEIRSHVDDRTAPYDHLDRGAEKEPSSRAMPRNSVPMDHVV